MRSPVTSSLLRPCVRERTDQDLMRAVAAGNREAFGELFERHVDAIHTYCFRRTADRSRAEELTSVVFLHAWRRRAEVRPLAAGLLPWLYGVALNVLRNDARGIRRRDLALARIARPADEPDFADDVAVRLDEERRMRQVLERV